MIRCSECNTENEPGAALCRQCGKELAAGTPASDRLPPLPTEAAPERRPLLVDRPVAEEPRPAEPVEPQAEPVSQPDLDLDPEHLEAITHFGRAKPILSVIGFASSGKTFFVNRLRDELPQRGGWKSNPPAAERIPLTPEGLQLTHLTPVTRAPSGHRGYVLVDCAGESLQRAFERYSEDRSLDGSPSRSLLAALAFASAYVLVLKAEDVVTGDQRVDPRVRSLTERFHDILAAIVLTEERLAGGEDPRELLSRGVSPSDLADAFERSHLRSRRPLCVVFSQADRLAAPPPADPLLFARQRLPKLFHLVADSFDHYRFEWVSAFAGHRAGDSEEDRRNPPAHYELPHHGVVPVFEWLHHLVAPRRGPVGRVRRVLDGGVPTARAVALRRWVDPGFRAAWRRA